MESDLTLQKAERLVLQGATVCVPTATCTESSSGKYAMHNWRLLNCKDELPKVISQDNFYLRKKPTDSKIYKQKPIDTRSTDTKM